MEKSEEQKRLVDLAKLFFWLGCVGFGGPAVHIAMMEEAVVRRRKWLTRQHFLDLVGATNLIPGPNSTELTMHIGYERAGLKGLFIAGASFIFPAVCITAILAWLYHQYGQLPQVQPFIMGIKPAIIAVVVSLMIGLGRKALKSVELGIVGTLAAFAVLAGYNEILILFGGGIVGMIIHFLKKNPTTTNAVLPLIFLQKTTSINELPNIKLFLIFLKIGSILYGSGYVLFAFLDAELVARGLLSKQQLIDSIAVGQFTPGPVFSSATFIGWQINGPVGAIAATIGIFLPSFLFVTLLNPLIPKLRKSVLFSSFLDAVNMVSIAVILSVVVELGRTALLDWRSILIAILSFAITFYYKRLNTAYIILGGGVLGYLLN